MGLVFGMKTQNEKTLSKPDFENYQQYLLLVVEYLECKPPMSAQVEGYAMMFNMCLLDFSLVLIDLPRVLEVFTGNLEIMTPYGLHLALSFCLTVADNGHSLDHLKEKFEAL